MRMTEIRLRMSRMCGMTHRTTGTIRATGSIRIPGATTKTGKTFDPFHEAGGGGECETVLTKGWSMSVRMAGPVMVEELEERRLLSGVGDAVAWDLNSPIS